jgi:multidrug efflux pump subunit AcrB
VATREALGIMQSNAVVGLLLVLGVCWLFLGSRISIMVALGVVFSVTGSPLAAVCGRLHAQRLGAAGHRHRARHAGG